MSLFRNTISTAMALTTGCCAIALAQQTAAANWSIAEVSAGTMQEIRTPSRTITPTPGSRLLDVLTVIRSATTGNPAIQASDIYVESPKGVRHELVGIGVTGYHGCDYDIADAIEATGRGISDGSGNGYQLQAPTKDKPCTILITKGS